MEINKKLPRIKVFTADNFEECKLVYADSFSSFNAKAEEKLKFKAAKFVVKNEDNGYEIDDEDTFADVLDEYPTNLEIVALRQEEKFVRGKQNDSQTSGTLWGSILNNMRIQLLETQEATKTKEGDTNQTKVSMSKVAESEDKSVLFKDMSILEELKKRRDAIMAKLNDANNSDTIEKAKRVNEELEQKLKDLLATTAVDKKNTIMKTGELQLKIFKAKLNEMRVSKLFDEFKQAEKVDICFLVDCTGSMDEYINVTKDAIHKITNQLQSKFKDFALRCAFVGYRDYGDEQDQLTVLNFTEDKEAFKSFVNRIVANGGGDQCEDVFGGIKAVVSSLDWRNMSRLVFHVADQPCHGKRFYIEAGDDYPDGHPDDPSIDELMQKFSEKNLTYYFAEISDQTVKMIEEFNEVLTKYGGSNIKTVHLNTAEDITEHVATSIKATIAESKSKSLALSHGKAKKSRVKSKLDWDPSHFSRHTATLYEPKNDFTLTDISTHVITWTEQKVVIYKAKNPFDEGSLRYAHAAYLEREKEQVKGIGSHLPKVILKESKIAVAAYNTMKYNREAIEGQLLTTFLANEFNKVSPSEKKVRFVEASIVKFDSDGSIYSMEEFLSGPFVKWSNNAGFINERNGSATLEAFAHWSYIATNEYLIVTDLQGTVSGSEYILTDPAITCPSDFDRFSTTNLGKKGLKEFFKSHHCNHICQKMNLKKHAYQTDEPSRISSATKFK